MPCILFDYGGTLDSDGTTWLERFLRIYEGLGVPCPRERFDRAFYDSDDNLPSRFDLKGLSLEKTLKLQVRCVLEKLAPQRMDLVEPAAGSWQESQPSFSFVRCSACEKDSGRVCVG